MPFRRSPSCLRQNATPDQLKEARKRADEALSQAKAAKTYEQFGLLAEKYSDDDYRVMMGDHKAVERAKLPPSVVQACTGPEARSGQRPHSG